MKQRQSILFEGDATSCSQLLPFAKNKADQLEQFRPKNGCLRKTINASNGDTIHITLTDYLKKIQIKAGALANYIFNMYLGRKLGTADPIVSNSYATILPNKNTKDIDITNIDKYEHLVVDPAITTNESIYEFPYIVHKNYDSNKSVANGVSVLDEHIEFVIDPSGTEIFSQSGYGQSAATKITDLGAKKKSTAAYSISACEFHGHFIRIQFQYPNFILFTDKNDVFSNVQYLPVPSFCTGTNRTDFYYWNGSANVQRLVQDVFGYTDVFPPAAPNFKFSPSGESIIALFWQFVDKGDKTLLPTQQGYYHFTLSPTPFLYNLNPTYDVENDTVTLNPTYTDMGKMETLTDMDWYLGYTDPASTEVADVLCYTQVEHEYNVTVPSSERYSIWQTSMYVDGFVDPIARANLFVRRETWNAGTEEWDIDPNKYCYNNAWFDRKTGSCSIFTTDYRTTASQDIESYNYLCKAFLTPVDTTNLPLKPQTVLDQTIGGLGAEIITIRDMTGTNVPITAPLDVAFCANIRFQSLFNLLPAFKHHVIPFMPNKMDLTTGDYTIAVLFYTYTGWIDFIDINGDKTLTHQAILTKLGIVLPATNPADINEFKLGIVGAMLI